MGAAMRAAGPPVLASELSPDWSRNPDTAMQYLGISRRSSRSVASV